jgi:hypothetical protein
MRVRVDQGAGAIYVDLSDRAINESTAAFSVNDWTAVVIFITVIGGIGRIEGPIIGTVNFFVMRQTLSDLGSIYLLIMGAVVIAVMLFAPKGLRGLIAARDKTGCLEWLDAAAARSGGTRSDRGPGGLRYRPEARRREQKSRKWSAAGRARLRRTRPRLDREYGRRSVA